MQDKITSIVEGQYPVQSPDQLFRTKGPCSKQPLITESNSFKMHLERECSSLREELKDEMVVDRKMCSRLERVGTAQSNDSC